MKTRKKIKQPLNDRYYEVLFFFLISLSVKTLRVLKKSKKNLITIIFNVN